MMDSDKGTTNAKGTKGGNGMMYGKGVTDGKGIMRVKGMPSVIRAGLMRGIGMTSVSPFMEGPPSA